VLFIFLRMFPQVTLLQSQMHEFLLVLPAFDHVLKLLAAAEGQREFSTGTRMVPTGPIESIEFRSVSFAYENSRPVLRNVSFDVKAGETAAIVGGSGAGKSTTIDLLLGLLQPQSGQICLNGAPLHESDISSWRRRIG